MTLGELIEEAGALDWAAVASSNLDAVAYSAPGRRLYVHFKGGSLYVYHGVPGAVHEGLVAAPSKGQFLDARVKKAGYAAARLR